MRNLHLYLFGFGALFVACHPVTPTTVTAKAVPTITIAANGQPEVDVVVSTVTKTTIEAGSVTDSATGTDLGIANMIRQEGPIEIWQYRFAECVVDFFFYPASQESSQLIIKNWDMRSVVISGRVNEGKCLAAMDRHHQKLVAGL